MMKLFSFLKKHKPIFISSLKFYTVTLPKCTDFENVETFNWTLSIDEIKRLANCEVTPEQLRKEHNDIQS